jgi:hypothetical protein
MEKQMMTDPMKIQKKRMMMQKNMKMGKLMLSLAP